MQSSMALSTSRQNRTIGHPASSRWNISLVLLVMFLWSLCFPLIATSLAMTSPLYFAALRSLVAGASLLLPAIALGRPLPRQPRVWLGILGIGLSFTSAGFAGMFLAGSVVTPGIASVLANTQPLIAAALAFFLLGERLRDNARLGMLLGFFGVVFTALPGVGSQGSGVNFSGIGFVMLGALGVAVGNILLKGLSGKADALMITGWQFTLGALPLLVLAQWLEAPLTISWNWSFVWTLLALGTAVTALPFLLWSWLLRRVELTRLNTFSFLTPIFALLISAIFLGERLQAIQIGGVALSFYGVWRISRQETDPLHSTRLLPVAAKMGRQNGLSPSPTYCACCVSG
ncbi:MAG: DMT family transporter [Anaerolineae bacterium]|nr:DMT family transporter [Anaerolineae bacterium]